MYKNFKITEEEKKQILESHRKHGYKSVIKEQDMGDSFKGEVIDRYSVDELIGRVIDEISTGDAEMVNRRSGRFSKRYGGGDASDMDFMVEKTFTTDDGQDYTVTLTFGIEFDEDEDGRSSSEHWDIEIDGFSVRDELSEELYSKLEEEINEFWRNFDWE